MDIGHSQFSVTGSCYPRYGFMKKQVIGLKDRTRKLRNELLTHSFNEGYIEPNRDSETMDRIEIDVLQLNEDKQISEKELLMHEDNCKNIRKRTNNQHQFIPSDLKKLKKKLEVLDIRGAALVLITHISGDKRYCNSIIATKNRKGMFTVSDHLQRGKKMKKPRGAVCLRQNLNFEIGKRLEINIFKEIKVCCEELHSLQEIARERQGNISAPMEKEYWDRIEDLLDDMHGLYNRSQVPEDEKPSFADRERTISDTLLKDLRKLSNLIRRCGYRSSTLYVFVDEETPNDSLVLEIGKVLRLHNIINYEVVSSFVKKHMSCASGSKLEVSSINRESYYGTLAGYLRSNTGDLFALLSRHVAKISLNRKIYITNGPRTLQIQGKIHNKTYNDSDGIILDVAIALIEGEDAHKCCFKYANEHGETIMPGTMCAINPRMLKTLDVYFRGATTSIGFGKVAIFETKSVQSGTSDNEAYLYIEKRGQAPFCDEGDSGAMVCTADADSGGQKVQLLSILIGENVGTNGLYTAVLLQNGLQFLENETGLRLSLC